MSQICLLHVIQILKQRSGRSHAHRKVLNAQPGQSACLEMPQQNFFAAVIIKDMGLQRIDGDMIPAPKPFHVKAADEKGIVAYDLRGLIFHHLIIELF